MASLHFFNPENDMALSSGSAWYTPSKGALTVRGAGQLLPMWWADEGDYILVSKPADIGELERLMSDYNLAGAVVESAPNPSLTPEPWGWSPYTARQFELAGICPTLLPSIEQLEALRQLSHRRTTITLHHLINTPSQLCPIEATSLNEAVEAVKSFDGRAVAKLPWSSSGRGVIYSESIPDATFREYLQGMIRRQGSVLIEPHHNRISDFAMLFYINSNGTVDYRGLSTFLTDSRGSYLGNVVASQSEIQRIISVDPHPWIQPLSDALSRIADGNYTGWAGIDMLVGADNKGDKVVIPGIEINWRRTMGVAALSIAGRLLPEQPLLLTLTPAGIRLGNSTNF